MAAIGVVLLVVSFLLAWLNTEAESHSFIVKVVISIFGGGVGCVVFSLVIWLWRNAP